MSQFIDWGGLGGTTKATEEHCAWVASLKPLSNMATMRDDPLAGQHYVIPVSPQGSMIKAQGPRPPTYSVFIPIRGTSNTG